MADRGNDKACENDSLHSRQSALQGSAGDQCQGVETIGLIGLLALATLFLRSSLSVVREALKTLHEAHADRL